MKNIARVVLLAIASISSKTTARPQRTLYTGDANNDGFLDRSELPESFTSKFASGGEIYWKVYEALTDTNGDGQVSLNEFIVYLGNADEYGSDEALGVFKVADKNRDNFIDKDEWNAYSALATGDDTSQLSTIEWRLSVLTVAGDDGDGKLNLDEFRNYYSAIQGLDYDYGDQSRGFGAGRRR